MKFRQFIIFIIDIYNYTVNFTCYLVVVFIVTILRDSGGTRHSGR